MLKRIAICAVALVVGAVCLEVGGYLVPQSKLSIISEAEAIVGRPLTPMSVAGVTRRTVRRCAVGVYNC
ncbi:MAG TPA: hypothetical protein VMT98_06285 [Verrucomicrobiae bacterium]|jgi:hypothetical protein|nr:hypothetical protein [Verrucomicrobiae bacterium]